MKRLSAATQLRVQLVFARALEALAETYQQQAAEFVRRLKTRLTVDEALQRFFREVAVPATLDETVRARALISLSGLIENSSRQEERTTSWTALRPDQLVLALRRRVRHVEETNLDCRLAASIADEAVAATHVRMALETAEVLTEQVTPNEAITLYVRSFNLPSIDAQVVYRTAMAQWAELHPLPGEAQAPGRLPAPPMTATRPRLELRSRPEFGLRVMV